jgi:hypothetical protein
MICPRCKYRFKKGAGRQLLTSSGKGRDPIELQVHSSSMHIPEDSRGMDREGYGLSLLLCPCGHPLMAAVYRCSESESDDYRPTLLQRAGP